MSDNVLYDDAFILLEINYFLKKGRLQYLNVCCIYGSIKWASCFFKEHCQLGRFGLEECRFERCSLFYCRCCGFFWTVFMNLFMFKVQWCCIVVIYCFIGDFELVVILSVFYNVFTFLFINLDHLFLIYLMLFKSIYPNWANH